MVLRGDLSPDPSNQPEENLLPSEALNVMPLSTSSDDEEEEISYEGYEVLPQHFVQGNNVDDDNDSQLSSDDENDINICPTDTKETSAFDQATKIELTELWNSANNNRVTDIVIDAAKEEQIKNAMAGFKLPLTAIPPWAEHIPEAEWKEQLINKVNLLNKVTSV